MLLQTYMYYTLRGLDLFCRSGPYGPQSWQMQRVFANAVDAAFTCMESFYSNLMAMQSEDSLLGLLAYTCLGHLSDARDVVRDPTDTSKAGCIIHLFDELYNGGFALMESLGYPEPEMVEPTCFYLPGQGYIDTLFPCSCMEHPGSALGAYSPEEREAIRAYFKIYGVEAQELSWNFIFSGQDKSCHDWIMTSISTGDVASQRDLRTGTLVDWWKKCAV